MTLLMIFLLAALLPGVAWWLVLSLIGEARAYWVLTQLSDYQSFQRRWTIRSRWLWRLIALGAIVWSWVCMLRVAERHGWVCGGVPCF